MTTAKTQWLIEASWEVCNKVGGIHTVLTSKMAHAKSFAGKGYIAVGPKVSWGDQPFHHELWPDALKHIPEKLQDLGIIAHYGTWLTDEQPACVLLDWSGLVSKNNAYKTQYWEKFQLDTLNTDFNDIDTPLLWSSAVGHFVAVLAEEIHASAEHPVLFHGHEWLAAGAFLQLADNASVKTVFTTHATVLGRAISSRGEDLYAGLPTYDAAKEAATRGVTTKHQLEALSAQKATIFTTVSAITAREARAFLGRDPEVLTENGIDPLLLPSFSELSVGRSESRQLLEDFIEATVFPSYRFDLRRTTHLFTMGRYETHNKGYDIMMRSLGKLNEELKKKNPDGQTVVGWFFVPGDQVGVKKEAHFQLAALQKIKRLLSRYAGLQQHELYASLWEEGERCANLRVLPAHVQDQVKQLLLSLTQYKEIPHSPFQHRNPERDDFLTLAKQNGLLNTEDDAVKVFIMPAYLDGFDGYFDRALYEVVAGCDLGIFPSCYEPWGYTPMEAMILGMPMITSNLAGFGLALQERKVPTGSLVIDRDDSTDDQVTDVLTESIADYLQRDDRLRELDRMAAFMSIQDFRWQLLYSRYLEAYNQALDLEV